jgi:hypothetical protein
MQTEQITQRLAIGAGSAQVPQIIISSGTQYANSDGVDMSKSRRAFFIAMIGAVTGGGSISAYLQESADNATWTANGTAGAFSGSGGNNVSQTGLTTSNKLYTFEVNASQLTTGKKFARLQLKETGGQNVYVAIASFGDEAEHKPNSGNSSANVVTQNVVS